MPQVHSSSLLVASLKSVYRLALAINRGIVSIQMGDAGPRPIVANIAYDSGRRWNRCRIR